MLLHLGCVLWPLYRELKQLNEVEGFVAAFLSWALHSCVRRAKYTYVPCKFHWAGCHTCRVMLHQEETVSMTSCEVKELNLKLALRLIVSFSRRFPPPSHIRYRVALALMLPPCIRRWPVRSSAGTSVVKSSLCSWFLYDTTASFRIRLGTPDEFILRYYRTLKQICRRCNIVKAARCSQSVIRCKPGMVSTLALISSNNMIFVRVLYVAWVERITDTVSSQEVITC